MTYQISLYGQRSFLLVTPRKVVILLLNNLISIYFVHQPLTSMKAGTTDVLGHHFITAHSIEQVPVK